MMDPVTLFLAALLLIGCSLSVTLLVCQEVRSRKMVPLTAVAAVCFCLCGAGGAGVVYSVSGFRQDVLYAGLGAFLAVDFVLVLRSFLRHIRKTNWVFLILFLIYCGMVASVTVLNRRVTIDKSVEMRLFINIVEAWEQRSWQSLIHDLLNVIMLMPAGFLIPLINRPAFGRIGHSLLFSLILSASIELFQLITYMGQTDINDIVDNVLGGLIGYLISACLVFVWKKIRGRE